MTLPSGRPRWLARMTRGALRLSRCRMVGRAARMRVSSVTLPSCERDVEVDADEDPLARGVEVADRELVHVSIRSGPGDAGSPPGGRSGRGQARRAATNADEVGDAAAVAPLVVVPGDDLHEGAAEDHRRSRR